MEEVVARNYLVHERPDAILNIIDGTNLERNLYLTTQLTELGIPVVLAVNMMDLVAKRGDVIRTKELSRQLGCKVVEISALKGKGIEEAAKAAVEAANGPKMVPQHTFSGVVEHALAHIEEAAIHDLPEEQHRWYAVKIFERDDKVTEQLSYPHVMEHIENDIRAVEKEMDDDAESIIVNERYLYIASVIKACYKKKNAEKLTRSDKIDRIITNRWLGLPIFIIIMFFVYWISMVGVGQAATDWANDGLFGDGWHLLGIGSGKYAEAEEAYGDTDAIIDAFIAAYGTDEMAEAIDIESEDFDGQAASFALADLIEAVPKDASVTYELEDEETLAVEYVEGATKTDLEAAAANYLDTEYKEAYGAPDTSTYGVWVPGIPVLMEQLLNTLNATDWVQGLVL